MAQPDPHAAALIARSGLKSAPPEDEAAEDKQEVSMLQELSKNLKASTSIVGKMLGDEQADAPAPAAKAPAPFPPRG